MPDTLDERLRSLTYRSSPRLAPADVVRRRGEQRRHRAQAGVALAAAAVVGAAVVAVTSLRPDGSASIRYTQTPTATPTPTAAPTSAPAPGPVGELRRDGFRSVQIGMTVPAAESALGEDLVREGDVLGNCYYVRPRDRAPQVLFMVVHDVVTRVEVDEGTERTAEGIGIGDTEQRVMAAYPGEVAVEPHPYTGGHYLHVRPDDRGLSYIFETDGTLVTQFRGGQEESVTASEGCA